MLKINAYQNLNLPEKVHRPNVSNPNEVKKQDGQTKVDFRSTLDNMIGQYREVHFSAHAKARLHSRGVILDKAKLDAISQAIDKAESRGARESLVLSDEAAYVVSIKSRTVITAFDRDNLRDGVFTSIDSAVIL